MSKEKVYLGRLLPDSRYGEELVWLEKHEWACGWYWSFGWCGNKNLHFHFDYFLNGAHYRPSNHFSDCKISERNWWVIRDLFIQAYALKKAAEVYRYGGYQTIVPGITDLIQDEHMAAKLNADLKIVLDKLWDILVEVTK